MPQSPDETTATSRIEADFRAIEQAAGPGILEMIQVYGDYAQAVRQADVYFELLSPSLMAISVPSTETTSQ